MRKINIAYAEIPGYNCFGCSKENPIGLKLDFYETEEGVFAEWLPTNDYEGYHNHLHGGIQATLLDEIGSWIIPVKIGSSGVTRSLNVNYLKPIYVDHGKITISAKLLRYEKNIATIEAKIVDHENIERANARIEYFVFSEEVARKRFHFPGKDRF